MPEPAPHPSEPAWFHTSERSQMFTQKRKSSESSDPEPAGPHPPFSCALLSRAGSSKNTGLPPPPWPPGHRSSRVLVSLNDPLPQSPPGTRSPQGTAPPSSQQDCHRSLRTPHGTPRIKLDFCHLKVMTHMHNNGRNLLGFK